ncbi:type II toxin-antitoxin system VapC family toxin [bacterium]|nr:type II toxin-antitoxin system VapC family toxin [bacterium]
MKPKVYIETSVISYLTGKISRDLIVAGHQQITNEWWSERKNDFDMYISQLVVQEASGGDPVASQKRLKALKELPLLEMNKQVADLSQIFVNVGVVPERAVEDSVHIATATIHKINYLLTWNCKHIANAEIRTSIYKVCKQSGYIAPIICTPEELLGG